MDYEVILFDADGTLFDYDKAEAQALEKTFKYFNFEYNEEKQLKKYREINKQIWIEYESGRISSQYMRIERFKQLFENYDVILDLHEFSKKYLSLLAAGIYLIDGAEEVCSYLSEKYKVVILTNGIKDVQNSRINNSVLKKYIKHIITSEETGYKKPDAGIFNYTFNKIGHVDKDKILIVGDSLSTDIKGGVNYGISTCWYNAYENKNLTELKPNYEIKDLRELLYLL
ncbi:YjjG family noncanonical pyrimidine nucleotidase [Inconstantimicrobium mannanitabidum]|uniref:Haloacid dehalogenase n=1 Tax=Inconstantimicrobium mannanitabidum TaxID=1604901 RepID=A0ACB5RCJ4_9CLOT|nr:YjjG family noncanonical pyrimidine nucleotidase [Clostridium sp. TW13]GKX66451.1 haloacid dehalogenase [Clostridium sp. TW13]